MIIFPSSILQILLVFSNKLQCLLEQTDLFPIIGMIFLTFFTMNIRFLIKRKTDFQLLCIMIESTESVRVLLLSMQNSLKPISALQRLTLLFSLIFHFAYLLHYLIYVLPCIGQSIICLSSLFNILYSLYGIYSAMPQFIKNTSKIFDICSIIAYQNILDNFTIFHFF